MADAAGQSGVNDVLITDELTRRPARQPDYQAESKALGILAQKLNERPDELLQTLTDLIIDMGIADSAGVSILAEKDGKKIFRWDALSGAWGGFKGGTMPFDASPCGVVVRRDQMLLFAHPERFFPDAKLNPLIKEILLVPFRVNGEPVGTLWINAHSPERKFDAEDARLMASLANFAAVAYQLNRELTEHRLAEEMLRESDARQAYLLELSDALRPLADPEAIQHEAMRVLGERLGVSRAQYYIADETGEYLSSSGGYTDGVEAAVGNFRLIEFGQYAYDGFHAGQTQVVCDARSDPRISEEVLRSYEAVGFLAYIGVPFVQRGRFLGTIAVHQTGPRQWTDSERKMVEETAQRAGIAVEQARAEYALRESEERYRSIFASMEDGFYFCEAIFDGAGKCVDLLYHDENDAAIRMTRQSFKGKRLSELGAYEPYWYEILGDTAKTGTPHRDEMFAAPDQIWYEFHTFKPPAARENELAIVFHNVNDRRKLAESEQRYRTLFESIDEGFCIADRVPGEPIDFRYVTINPAFESQTGLDNALGRTFREAVPEVEEEVMAAYARVAETGVPESFSAFGLDRCFQVEAVTTGHAGQIAVLFRDITATRRAETALRESEERQAFLLKLSDAVRPRTDPADIQGETTRLLREQLNAGWCYYVDWDSDKKLGVVLRDSARDGLPSLAGAHDVSDASEFLRLLTADAVLTVHDYTSYEQLPTRIRQQFTALGFRSMMAAPLVKQGRLLATVIVGDTQVRDWTASEASLLVEVAERTWAAAQRARAEEALRESEARLAAAFESVPAGLAALDLDGRAVIANAEYRRFLPTSVIPSRDPARRNRWKGWDEGGELLDPRDWPSARALRGESVVPGQEMLYTDDDGREIWTNVATAPTFDESGKVTGVVSVVSDIDERKRAEEALRDSERQANTLLAELQHRVRNILAMMRSVIGRAAASKTDVPDFVAHLQGRISAMARTQAILTRKPGQDVDLEQILRDEMLADASKDEKVRLKGPAIALSPKAAEVLTLAIHELSTNSLKYGAMADDGRVLVTWEVGKADGEDWLELCWEESGVAIENLNPAPGFGTELITQRVPYELGGTSVMIFNPDGLTARIHFPLRPGSSLLQTDAGSISQGASE